MRLIVAAIVVVVAACGRGVEARDPSLIGVVASREFRSGSMAHLVLKSGQSVDISQNGSVKVLNGGSPDVGDLLFYGETPEPWFAALQPNERGEFTASSRVDDASDGSITFDSGLRLPIAAPGYREVRGPMETGRARPLRRQREG